MAPLDPARHRSGSHAAVLVLTAALTLTGCSVGGSGIDAPLQQTSSAVQTARLGLALDAEGDSTRAVTTTVLKDARTETLDAAATLAELDAADTPTEHRRTEALSAVRASVDALNAALTALAADDSPIAARASLAECADDLERLVGP